MNKKALAETSGLLRFWVRSTAVVRSAVNRMVEGSNPSCPAKFAGLVQWQNGSLVSCASEVRFLCPAPEPTAWDPSANEPTLPYPHIASLSLAFLFRPQTIICWLGIIFYGIQNGRWRSTGRKAKSRYA